MAPPLATVQMQQQQVGLPAQQNAQYPLPNMPTMNPNAVNIVAQFTNCWFDGATLPEDFPSQLSGAIAPDEFLTSIRGINEAISGWAENRNKIRRLSYLGVFTGFAMLLGGGTEYLTTKQLAWPLFAGPIIVVISIVILTYALFRNSLSPIEGRVSLECGHYQLADRAQPTYWSFRFVNNQYIQRHRLIMWIEIVFGQSPVVVPTSTVTASSSNHVSTSGSTLPLGTTAGSSTLTSVSAAMPSTNTFNAVPTLSSRSPSVATGVIGTNSPPPPLPPHAAHRTNANHYQQETAIAINTSS